MENWWKQTLLNLDLVNAAPGGFLRENVDWMKPLLLQVLDISLVLALIYMVLVVTDERRIRWMIQGFIVLLLASEVSTNLGLRLLTFVLDKLVLGSAVAMAVILQSEFRRFLEQLGRGEFKQLLRPSRGAISEPDSLVDEIVDAVKELSQNRIGALMILETSSPIDERVFSVPGVRLNAEVSKELLQTIFVPKTLLHDGAILIRGSRIVAAGVILPLSGRTASRQLGTRHRAAMGITDKVENCICVVVSEETGSISLAERGTLNRPLTSSKLKELLEERFSPTKVEREAAAPDPLGWGRQIIARGLALSPRLSRLFSSGFRKKK